MKSTGVHCFATWTGVRFSGFAPRAWLCQRHQLLLRGPRLGDFLSLAYPMPSGNAVLRWQGGLSLTEMTT